MTGYASNTGTRRNLEALRKAGWRILLTPNNPKPREGLRFGIDNGAWRCFQRNEPFNDQGFASLVERLGAGAVGEFLREYPKAGLFLGGSTEYKLREMFAWGMVAHAFGRHYHIGRVNTARRIQLAEEAGADSFDGTSASRYSCTLPLLEAARSQPRLFTARTEVA